jgi:hypothetical protein
LRYDPPVPDEDRLKVQPAPLPRSGARDDARSLTVGYALMKMPLVLNAAYELSPFAQRNRDEISQLRDKLTTVKPAAYRGIARCPLSEIPEPDPGWVGATPPISLETRDDKARRRFLEILGGHHTCDHYPCSLFPTLALAHELLLLVDHPEEYEVVRLSRDSSEAGHLLGFDVGDWSGGNYSILCDSIIWPRWHPPVPVALSDLAHHIETLNDFMLFPDRASAERFRSFYLTQSWAETESEPGEFCVIRVELVE